MPVDGTLPNLIIMGAQKCATTSLHYYLNLHPQIFMSAEKELRFFIQEHNWHNGVAWYKSHFAGNAKIHGEASPGYTNYPFFDGVPERMYSIVPEAKLIYILRDPIERMISQYVHCYAEGGEDRTIDDALSDRDNNPYALRSRYYMQLKQYLKYFPQSHILVLTQEDLRQYRRETMQHAFRFLRVDDTFYSRRFSLTKHPSSWKRRKTPFGRFLAQTPIANTIKRLPYGIRVKAEDMVYLPFSRKIMRPELREALRKTLTGYLKDDIDCLRAYTGRSFEEWCIRS